MDRRGGGLVQIKAELAVIKLVVNQMGYGAGLAWRSGPNTGYGEIYREIEMQPTHISQGSLMKQECLLFFLSLFFLIIPCKFLKRVEESNTFDILCVCVCVT